MENFWKIAKCENVSSMSSVILILKRNFNHLLNERDLKNFVGSLNKKKHFFHSGLKNMNETDIQNRCFRVDDFISFRYNLAPT